MIEIYTTYLLILVELDWSQNYDYLKLSLILELYLIYFNTACNKCKQEGRLDQSAMTLWLLEANHAWVSFALNINVRTEIGKLSDGK